MFGLRKRQFGEKVHFGDWVRFGDTYFPLNGDTLEKGYILESQWHLLLIISNVPRVHFGDTMCLGSKLEK